MFSWHGSCALTLLNISLWHFYYGIHISSWQWYLTNWLLSVSFNWPFPPHITLQRSKDSSEPSVTTETARCFGWGSVLWLCCCVTVLSVERKDTADSVVSSQSVVSTERGKTSCGIQPRQRHWHCATAPLASSSDTHSHGYRPVMGGRQRK